MAGFLALVIGVVLIVYGIVGLDKDVTCGGQVMKPGDSCVSLGNGGGSRDYEQQHSKNQREAWLAIGGGGVLLLLGGAAAGFELRRRRRASAPQLPA